MDAPRERVDWRPLTKSESQSEKSMGVTCCTDLEERDVNRRAMGRMDEWVEPSNYEHLYLRELRSCCEPGY